MVHDDRYRTADLEVCKYTWFSNVKRTGELLPCDLEVCKFTWFSNGNECSARRELNLEVCKFTWFSNFTVYDSYKHGVIK